MTYSHVTTAINNELKNLAELEKWRDSIDLKEFAKDPIDYIEKNAPPLLAPFELWRYGEHFAKDKTEKDGAHARARVQLKYMLARRAVNEEGKGRDVKIGKGEKDDRTPNEQTIRDLSNKIFETNLEDTYTFATLLGLLGKDQTGNKPGQKKKTKLNF